MVVEDRNIIVITISVFDQDGNTALMIAAQGGHHECLSILLAHGADVNKAGRVSAVSTPIEQHGAGRVVIYICVGYLVWKNGSSYRYRC